MIYEPKKLELTKRELKRLLKRMVKEDFSSHSEDEAVRTTISILDELIEKEKNNEPNTSH